MQTITILISAGPDGNPFYQVIPSDGVDPMQAIAGCWQAIMSFQRMAIDAGIARGLEETQEEAEE